jgi:hypothetical protein
MLINDGGISYFFFFKTVGKRALPLSFIKKKVTRVITEKMVKSDTIRRADNFVTQATRAVTLQLEHKNFEAAALATT